MNKFLATAGVLATLTVATSAFAGDMRDQGPINTNAPKAAAQVWAPADDVNGDIYPVMIRNQQTPAVNAHQGFDQQLATQAGSYQPITQ